MNRPSGENVTSVCNPGANVRRVSGRSTGAPTLGDPVGAFVRHHHAPSAAPTSDWAAIDLNPEKQFLVTLESTDNDTDTHAGPIVLQASLGS